MNFLQPSHVRSTGTRAQRNRRGATMVLMTIMLPVSLAIASYCINIVYLELTRTELQISTDVATRAAGRTLAITGDKVKATEAAERLLALNLTANKSVTLDDVNINFGVSTRTSEIERYKFADGKNVNAVQIESNGSFDVPMLFPTMGVPMTFRPFKTAISTQSELDIALVLDRSGSMAYADDEISDGAVPPAAAPPGWTFGNAAPPNSRWLDTVAAVNEFINLLANTSHDERVSLSTYNEKSKFDEKLTNDYVKIQDAMSAYTAKFDGGATNIGDGVLEGLKTLGDKLTARPWASRVMIVLSDGNHNTGTDPLAAAKIAAAEDVMIYTVTFSQEADQALMQSMAIEGGGQHFHAVTSAELAQAFEDIAHSLPTLITF